MAPRVSPSERVRAEIDALFSSDRDLASVLEEVGLLAVRLLMQQAIEAEVDIFLGRASYERRSEEHPAGSRNGWQPPFALKTAMARSGSAVPSSGTPTGSSAPSCSASV